MMTAKTAPNFIMVLGWTANPQSVCNRRPHATAHLPPRKKVMQVPCPLLEGYLAGRKNLGTGSDKENLRRVLYLTRNTDS